MRAAESKWSDRKKSSRRKIRALNIPKSAWNQSCRVDGQKSEHKQFKKLALSLSLSYIQRTASTHNELAVSS